MTKNDQEGNMSDKEEEDWKFCQFCQLNFSSINGYMMHLRGSAHIFNVNKKEADSSKVSSTDKPASKPTSVPPSSNLTKEKKNDKEIQEVINEIKEDSKSKEEEDEENERTYCSVCDIKYSKESAYWAHTRGLAHYHQVERLERRQHPEAYQQKHAVPEPKQEAVQQRQWDASWPRDQQPQHVAADGSQTFFCEVCEISCTGYKCFQEHIDGKNHLKKVKKLKKVEERLANKPQSEPRATASQPNKCSIQHEIDDTQQPLLGLDYVTEFQKEDQSVEPRFVCDLCCSKMDPRQVVSHVLGSRHRLKYLKYHARSLYDQLSFVTKQEKTELCRSFAERVQQTEGLYTVRLKIESDPFQPGPQWRDIDTGRSRNKICLPGLKSGGDTYEDEQADEMLLEPDPYLSFAARRLAERAAHHTPPASKPTAVIDYGHANPTVKCTDDRAPSPHECTPPPPPPRPQEAEVSEADRLRFASARKNAKHILRSLGQCEVTNEHDAEVALQISNSLTQALLAYRMGGLTGAVEGSSGAVAVEMQQQLESLSQHARAIERTHHDDMRALEAIGEPYDAAAAARPPAPHRPPGNQLPPHNWQPAQNTLPPFQGGQSRTGLYEYRNGEPPSNQHMPFSERQQTRGSYDGNVPAQHRDSSRYTNEIESNDPSQYGSSNRATPVQHHQGENSAFNTTLKSQNIQAFSEPVHNLSQINTDNRIPGPAEGYEFDNQSEDSGSNRGPAAHSDSRVGQVQLPDTVAAASDLITNLGDIDVSVLSCVDTARLSEALAAVSDMNEDLARHLPPDVVQAAGALISDSAQQHATVPDLAALSQQLAMHFPSGLIPPLPQLSRP